MPKKKNNVWKIISIVVIIVFIFILVGALIRTIRFRSSFTNPTDSQISTVKGIALADMVQRGEDPQNYNVTISNRIRPVMTGQSKNILEVAFYNDTIRHAYIIDVDAGTILMYSRTESFGFINFSNDRNMHPDQMPDPGPGQGFFGWLPRWGR